MFGASTAWSPAEHMGFLFQWAGELAWMASLEQWSGLFFLLRADFVDVALLLRRTCWVSKVAWTGFKECQYGTLWRGHEDLNQRSLKLQANFRQTTVKLQSNYMYRHWDLNQRSLKLRSFDLSFMCVPWNVLEQLKESVKHRPSSLLSKKRNPSGQRKVIWKDQLNKADQCMVMELVL